MSSSIRSRVSELIPTTSMQVWFVQVASLSASVRTNVLSISFVKKPTDVGLERPWPAGMAIADRPSLNWFESEIKTNIPFVMFMIRILMVPAAVSEENSEISSNSIFNQLSESLGGINH